MASWLGKWMAMALICAQITACALQPASHEAATAASPTRAMGNSAAATPADVSPEGAAVAAELGYHGPIRRAATPLD